MEIQHEDIKNLENDLSNLFELFLTGRFDESEENVTVVKDSFLEFVTNVSNQNLEGMANYFGFLYANWEDLEVYHGEHFDSIQNLIMLSLGVFGEEADSDYFEQIKAAMNDWPWVVELPTELSDDIITAMIHDSDVIHGRAEVVVQAVENEQEQVEAADNNAEQSIADEESLTLDSSLEISDEVEFQEETTENSETLEELEALAAAELEAAAEGQEDVDETSEMSLAELAGLAGLESEEGESVSLENHYKLILSTMDEAEGLALFPGESIEFTDEQNEIILILTDELKSFCSMLETTTTDANMPEKLAESEFLIQNLIGAIDVIGFSELTEVLELTYMAVETTGANPDATQDETMTVLIWPWAINNLFTTGINSKSLHIVSGYLQLVIPELDVEELNTLVSGLRNIDLEALEANKRDVQEQATLEDLDLTPDDDTNPELIQSFLSELMDYTSKYTTSINNFLKDGLFSELDVARRLVHTIKGSGNTTGIRGIANYSHNLEDILDEISKKSITPSESLSEMLIESADYLEIMGESVIEGTELPEDIVENYQKILDWAYALDNGLTIEDLTNDDSYEKESKDEKSTEEAIAELDLETQQALQAAQQAEQDKVKDKAKEQTQKASEAKQEPQEKKPKEKSAAMASAMASAGEAIRVTKTQIEDLIRVVGENMISSGQVLEHAQSNRMRLVEFQHQYMALNHLIQELEQLVFVRGINSDRESSGKAEFDPLEMERYNELHTVTQRIIESSMDGIELLKQSINGNVTLETIAVDQIRLQRDNQNQVIQMRMLPVSYVSNRFARAVRQTCRKTNKKVDFNLVGESTLVDSNVLQELVEPIMHILRNSIDHGIESKEQRLAANKPAKGSLTLKFEKIADHINVTCKDDGQGLNHEKIIEKARQKGLINENQEHFSDEEIARFILIPGFSTKDELSHVSGRGIGMDVVNQKIHEIRGSLKINSVQNQGTEISISIPVSLMSTHALVLKVANKQIALSNRGIEDIVYLDDSNLERIRENEIIHWNDEAINVYLLSDLLNLKGASHSENKTAIIVALSDGSYKAVMAPFVDTSRDLFVKPLSQFLPRIDGLIGASVLGDGSVTPVYDLTELNQKFQADNYIYNTESNQVQERYDRMLPSVLVVDDSLSARRSMTSFVRDLGYNVIEAQDGIEAQEILQDNEVMLVITDLEMPRMNGLDLTSHIKSRDKLRSIPIIMVTSRSTEKHRAIAKKAGVTEYVVKPFDEDELAEKLNQMLS